MKAILCFPYCYMVVFLFFFCIIVNDTPSVFGYAVPCEAFYRVAALSLTEKVVVSFPKTRHFDSDSATTPSLRRRIV